MTYLSISHIDACLSCYLQDHHNRDGEWLIGVPVDNSTTYANIRAELANELEVGDAPENAPDWSADEIKVALDDLFSGVKDMAALFDGGSEVPDDYDGEMPQAWFLVEWETEEDEEVLADARDGLEG